MKPFKLSKLKTNDANYGSANPQSGGREKTFKASYEDLRSPDGRQSLRQHLNSEFPEAHRTTSQDSLQTYEMTPKDRLSRTNTSNLSVGQNSTAISSSSSVDSVGGKRLSTVRESNTKLDIDITQAINLLQELKKTASPDELVALHKALLPARDSVVVGPSLPVNEERSSVSSASVIRHRSMLPAGLATRGAIGDLLRTQEEAEAPKKLLTLEEDEWGAPRHQRSKSSLVALDLAAKGPNALNARVGTPSDHDYTHAGTYHRGTLRIMNGAASPEPSVSGRSLDLMTADSKAGGERPMSRGYATAPNTPEGRPVSMEIHLPETMEHALREPRSTPRRSDTPEHRSRDPSQSRAYRQARPVSGIPVPEDRDESTPRIYKRTRSKSRKARSRDVPGTQVTPPRDPSQSHIPLRVERQTSSQSLVISRPPSKQSLQSSKRSLEPIRRSIDDGRVSPLVESEMPRFAQRWSHRASDISHRASRMSQEYVSDCEISSSPYDDRDVATQELRGWGSSAKETQYGVRWRRR